MPIWWRWGGTRGIGEIVAAITDQDLPVESTGTRDAWALDRGMLAQESP